MYEETIHIRFFEVNGQGQLKLGPIFNYLQDMADKDASRMNISIPQLMEKGYTWVLHRYHLEMIRYPKLDESLVIRTWHSPLKNLYSLRAFEIRTQSGEALGKAVTSWIIIDYKSHKPVRLDRHVSSEYYEEVVPFEFSFSPIPPLKHIDLEESFPVRMRDLDINNHVNNAVYVEWAAETVPTEVLQTQRPVTINVLFKEQLMYGDAAIVQTQRQKASNSFDHIITRQSDGAEVSRIHTLWERIE